MILLIYSMQTLVSGFLSCDETNYETLVLEPTNPFYKEQFQMNENDFKKDTDALSFVFWSQYRPYQDIVESHQVDYAFQQNKTINGDLLFSIRNVDTNKFETAYFLYYPLFTDYIYQKLAQYNLGYYSFALLKTITKRYEGLWIQTQFFFLPLKSQLQVYFITYQQVLSVTLDFKLNKYGKKEIIIGGTGKLFNFYNLGSFHGRMSKPISLQLIQSVMDFNEFLTYYNSCNSPKSCSGKIKIDIIKDQLYMDSTTYITQIVRLYENSYSFGGWVKVDLSDIFTRPVIPLIIATINRNYSHDDQLQLGDNSFKISYLIDMFTNKSQIIIKTYSYIIPQLGYSEEGNEYIKKYLTDQIQYWHFIKFSSGNGKELFQIFLPKIKIFYSYYFFQEIDNNIGGNQFTSDYLYLYIGGNKYQLFTQFQGWLRDFQILTCLDSEFTVVQIACHFTCLPTIFCEPDKCDGCPIDSHRLFLQIKKSCECEDGFYTVQNQPICQNFGENFRFIQFSTSHIIKISQCELGYYQYQNMCHECPSIMNDNYKVSCLECIYNKTSWYLNPVCETDYIKLIGQVNEPFYSRSRSINEIDLFRINSFNYLELNQGCYQYCDKLSIECFLSNYYHLGNQMIVKCKKNYFFDQNLLECEKCQNNCEICNSEGKCLSCSKQHYFDPILQQCLQCDIRCEECQYDQQLNKQVCISCPEYFTLYNGICLKCGVYCKFCMADHYLNTGEVYARCYQCLENKDYFISFDAINCHINPIKDCIYAFQYYEADRHVQTIDMMFQPRTLNQSIITGCAKCKFQYMYIISERICISSGIPTSEYCIQEDRSSDIIVLAEASVITQNITIIQQKKECTQILNCEACIYFKTDRIFKCTQCYIGFYTQMLRGNCIKCPELNCQVCAQQQKINKDHFKLEYQAFYEWFVNFDGLHNYEAYAQSQNEADFEIVCTTCHFGYQLLDGHCVKDCPENCAECIQSNGQLQCLRCFDTIQGTMQTLINNECIQCPYNCAVCIPQDSIKVYQYNPYFFNTEYSYFTNKCLRLIKELPEDNYYYDPEIGNYIKCGELQQCYQEVHLQMVVHCNDESFEQLLSSSSNKVEFRQQNIKLSQLFSNSTATHIPQYQNDIVYMRFNEMSIKKINQTYIFTDSKSKCIISEDSKLQNQFNKNVYSIKETIINFIGIDDSVKIYLNSQLQVDGFTQVLFKNIEFILITTNYQYIVNSIIISHLISVELTLERINFTSQSPNSTINLSIFNSSSVTMNNCQVSNQIFIRNNFINIQNPLWQFLGLDHYDIMNVAIEDFSLLNCTFLDSSVIHIVLDNKFVFCFKKILIQAEFFNSFFITQFQTFQFSNKTIIFDSINIQSKIVDTDGFLNLEFIDGITVNLLTYNNSIISNSIFIKSNNEFVFNQLNFINLQMIGNSILIKYVASELNIVNNIVIYTLNIFNVSYTQIHPFIYFINQGHQNQLQLISLGLEANYLTKYLQNSILEIFYYSALIYVEMQNIFIANSNILRMPGYQEFALVNTQNITLFNLTIDQLEPIKGLHQYLDCQQQQNYGNQYFSVISIFQAKYTLLYNIQAQKLILYNHPLIRYQSIDLSQKLQQETVLITQCVFFSNLILITQDIKSSSIIMIQSEQLIEIEINKITFIQNQINIYAKGNSIHSCLINIQCISCTANFDQLEVINNLVTNDTNPLFYVNVKSLKLKNSQFLRNNYFDYDKIKGNLMWSFPNNTFQVTAESLQNLFPIKSDGLFIIYFEALFIDNTTIRQAQGCKGGAFQLYSKQRGIVNITNSHFIQIRASLNCDQSLGGVLYLDSTKGKLIATISQNLIDNVMSLNLGGFMYVISAANELNITISNVMAKNYQSLKGSFIYASLQYSNSIAQELNIYNCSLTIKFPELIEYLGYLSTFKNLANSNLIKDRVQFFFINGQISMKQITIHTLNYESFIHVSGCIYMDFSQLYFGGGNYSNNPLFSIEFDPLKNQKLNFDDIKIQNVDFTKDIHKSNNPSDTLCQNKYEFNVAKLTLLCQQSLNYNLPVALYQILSTDFLYSIGFCYLEDALSNLTWESFSLIKISSISTYHHIKMNQIAFQNNICNKCQNGLLNINFEQGLNNRVQIIDLKIVNSTCGTLGCLVLNQGQLDQSTLLYRNTRLLNTLEKDYFNMNFTLKIDRYTCLGNVANFGVCLFIHNIELQIIDSQFSNNYAISSGGAIYSTNTKEQLSLIRTIMVNNTANQGDNVIYQNQILSNLTKTQSFSNYSRNHINQIISVPQQLKITKQNHSYYQPNIIQSQNNKFQLDLSLLNESFQFPNGQSIGSYQYFDIKSEQYVQLNLSLRLVALNNLDQEQIEIQGTMCNIYTRMIQNLDDNVEFTQNYTNFKSLQFNINTKDYNLDDLILNFDTDLQETMFLQLQFTCNSIKVPIYLENDPYNINDWHDQYFLRTSLIKPLPCQIGEIKHIDTHICQLCDSSSGFYSVKFNQNKCSPKNDITMISVTSAQINLKQFYWRPYLTSDLIQNCFNMPSNCQGGWEIGDKSCFIGHIGALCEQCDLYNIRGNGQYSTSSTYTCGSCSTISQNMLIICFVTTLTLISIIISVKSTDGLITDLGLWKKYMAIGILLAQQKAQPGVLIKILINYFQIVGSLNTFKLIMPSWISSIIITSSDPIQSMAYSLDCFIIDLFQIPILYGRIIWHFIMLVTFNLATLILFYLMNIKSKETFRQGVISTIFIYIFIFLQPNIIKSLISSISFRKISGYRWVQGHVAYRYDSDLHQAWLPYLISLLISVVILIPAYFVKQLFQIKDNLNVLKNRSIWGILYNEYKKSAYYWEIVRIFLKVVIIIILTYYEDFIFVKAALISLFIQLYLHYLHKQKPYNLIYLNKLEILSAKTCSISMILGLILYSSQQQYIYEVEYPLFSILFICNARFLRNIFLNIIIAYLNKFQIQFDELKEKIKQRFPQLKEKIPYCVIFLENRTEKKQLVYSKFRRIVRQIIRSNETQRKMNQEQEIGN